MTTSVDKLGMVYVFPATPQDITIALNRKAVPKGRLAKIEQARP